MYQFSSDIYDIRGTTNNQISNHYAENIGQKFTQYIKAKKIIVGYDNRFSSPELAQSLVKKINCNIIMLGLCTTPMLYFAAKKLNMDGGIMITGSHNPINQNGFKLLHGDLMLYGSGIANMISHKITKHNNSNHKIIFKDITEEYIEDILINHKPSKKLRILWDTGNCTTSCIIHKLVKKMPQHEHILINDLILQQATTDPTKEENLEKTVSSTKKHHCDVGFAFDSDGDRIGIIDNRGNILSNNQIFMLFIQNHPNIRNNIVIKDVKISDKINKIVKDMGGRCILSRTGHSFIRHMMKEKNAVLAGEGSQHIYFADKKYDDALYAAIMFINILSQNSWDDILSRLPQINSSPEIRIPIKNKLHIINLLRKKLQQNNIIYDDIDGIRVSNNKGWWLVRASNTEEALVICYEGNTKKHLQEIRENLRNILNEIDLNISLNFLHK